MSSYKDIDPPESTLYCRGFSEFCNTDLFRSVSFIRGQVPNEFNKIPGFKYPSYPHLLPAKSICQRNIGTVFTQICISRQDHNSTEWSFDHGIKWRSWFEEQNYGRAFLSTEYRATKELSSWFALFFQESINLIQPVGSPPSSCANLEHGYNDCDGHYNSD